MKKLSLLLLVFVGFMACENGIVYEQPQVTFTTEGIIASGIHKIDVCHFDEDNDSWHLINISTSALEAHEKHGDIILIDEDGDGWVSFENECVDGGDCDDNDNSVYPGAEEICGDDIDNNCDGQIDEDCSPCSGDNIGVKRVCKIELPDGTICDGEQTCTEYGWGPCEFPEEVCGDGIDNNCDGYIDEGCPIDSDDDGYNSDVDCDDNNSTVYPGQTEYFSVPFGSNSYDYNCDAQNTKRWNELYKLTSAGIFTPGWVSSIPDCGNTGSFATGVDFLGTLITVSRTQECK